jgi:NADH-quinone oxidoreductase subunit E
VTEPDPVRVQTSLGDTGMPPDRGAPAPARPEPEDEAVSWAIPPGGDSGTAGEGELAARLAGDAAKIIARYPRKRSAILPLLHLVQADQGHVTPEGIAFCADLLGLTEAEVTGTLTYYTMFKQHPVGEYHVGVCTNTLCAVMGGDAILDSLRHHLGIGNDQTTADGKITLEHIECNAACDYAPVVMVNWEFFDNMTPDKARDLVDRLRAGESVAPTRGAPRLCTWRQAARILAGFPDGQAHEGDTAGQPTLAGLRIAREQDR